MAAKLKKADREGPRAVNILVVPQYSMLELSAVIDPLRVANRLAGRPLYEVTLISIDGRAVTASNGVRIEVDRAIADVAEIPFLVVCSSFDPEAQASPELMAWLRDRAAAGTVLAAIDTGAALLAAAGLLDGYRATCHWESIAAYAERFPKVQFCEELFLLDRDRFTCAGGTAAVDMVLWLIERHHGARLANGVGDQLVHDRARHRGEMQKTNSMKNQARADSRLKAMIHAMEEHLEDTLTIDQLATIGNVSRRQLDRLFRDKLNTTPCEYYLKLRMERAKQLLTQTNNSITSVGMACGFSSTSTFSRACRASLKCSPREYRNAVQREGSMGVLARTLAMA